MLAPGLGCQGTEGKLPHHGRGGWGWNPSPAWGVPPSQAAPLTLSGALLHRVVCPASPVTSPGKSDEAETVIILFV